MSADPLPAARPAEEAPLLRQDANGVAVPAPSAATVTPKAPISGTPSRMIASVVSASIADCIAALPCRFRQ